MAILHTLVQLLSDTLRSRGQWGSGKFLADDPVSFLTVMPQNMIKDLKVKSGEKADCDDALQTGQGCGV